MPLDTGDVTIGLDGVATGTGLAKLLYDALADEHDAFPNQLPAPNTPGAQESLAKLARAIAAPIAIAVNEGVEVTANPGQVLGNEIDAGSPNVAHPLTPAELNAIVGSIALHLAQYLGFGPNPAGVPVGDIRGDGPFAIVGNGLVELGSLGAGGVGIIAAAGPASLHGVTLDLEATAGAASIEATAGIDLSPGANEPVRISSGLIRLIERAAGIALSAGQALFFAKNDAPNNPYFRDDTNVDRKLLTAPAALGDLAPIAAGTALGLQVDAAGPAVPVALSGLEIAELYRNGTVQAVSLTAGTTNDLALNADTTVLRCTPTGAQTLTGVTGGAQGRMLLIENVAADGNPITLPSLTGSLAANRFRTSRGLPCVVGFRETAAFRWETNNGDWRHVGDSSRALLLTESAAGETLAPGQAQFFARNDTPNTPMFRDDTNVDHKLVRAPVPLTDLATIAVGTMLGNQIDAGAAAAPKALTGAEQGENYRSNTRQTVAATGTMDITLNDDTTILVLQLSADTILRSISNTAAGDGRLLRIEHDAGAAFTLTLGHNLATPTFFPLYNPNERAMNVRRGATVNVRTRSGFWRPEYPGSRIAIRKNAGTTFDRGRANVVDGIGITVTVADVPATDEISLTFALADAAQGTALGRPALGGTAAPVALTGLQQGENLRRGTYVADAASSGVVATYTITADLCQVLFTGSGNITLHGATSSGATFGKPIEWAVDEGAAAVVQFVNESGSAGAGGERFRTPSGQTLTIRAGELIASVYFANRHRLTSVCKRIDPELIAPVRSNLGVPFTVHVAFSATGVTGTMIDVTVWLMQTFNLRIKSAHLRVLTAAGTGAALRTAAAGGGSVVLPDPAVATQTFSTATAGPKDDAATATATVTAGNPLYFNVDRAVAGELILECVRT